MRNLALGLTAASIAAFAAHEQPTAPAHDWKIKSALTSVAINSDWRNSRDADDPGVGGAYEGVSFFSNILVHRVQHCTDVLKTAFTEWTNEHKFQIRRMSVSAGSILAYADQAGLNGVFEFTYHVDLERQSARVTLYFYSNDNERHEINGLRNLTNTYEIEAFQTRLAVAIDCGAA